MNDVVDVDVVVVDVVVVVSLWYYQEPEDGQAFRPTWGRPSPLLEI